MPGSYDKNFEINIEERNLLLLITKFDYFFNLSLSSMEPHHLAEYLFSLSQAFNSFYTNNKIFSDFENLDIYWYVVNRKNYSFLKNIEIKTSAELLYHMSNQFILDKKMRRYIFDQAFEWMPSKFFKAAKSITCFSKTFELHGNKLLKLKVDA